MHEAREPEARKSRQSSRDAMCDMSSFGARRDLSTEQSLKNIKVMVGCFNILCAQGQGNKGRFAPTSSGAGADCCADVECALSMERDWPSERVRELIRQGAGTALNNSPVWLNTLHQATLASAYMQAIADDPVLAKAIRRCSRSN